MADRMLGNVAADSLSVDSAANVKTPIFSPESEVHQSEKPAAAPLLSAEDKEYTAFELWMIELAAAVSQSLTTVQGELRIRRNTTMLSFYRKHLRSGAKE